LRSLPGQHRPAGPGGTHLIAWLTLTRWAAARAGRASAEVICTAWWHPFARHLGGSSTAWPSARPIPPWRGWTCPR